MDIETFDHVLEKLADKLGVAVEALQPLSEQVVREVVLSNSLIAAANLLMLVVFVTIAWRCFKRLQASEDIVNDDIGYVAGLVFAAICCIPAIVEGVIYLSYAVSPHVQIMKMLLG